MWGKKNNPENKQHLGTDEISWDSQSRAIGGDNEGDTIHILQPVLGGIIALKHPLHASSPSSLPSLSQNDTMTFRCG